MFKFLNRIGNIFFISITSLFISSSWIFGQDVMAIHFDRPFYLNGDNVRFKIYLTEPNKKETFLDLLVENQFDKDLGYNFFIPIKDNIGYGSFSIPHTSKTSTWKMEGQWFDAGNSQISRIFNTHLKVFNDSEEISPISAVPKSNPVNPSGIIKIHFDKPIYHPGEQVHLKVNTSDMSGNPSQAKLSVSILHRPYVRSDQPPMSSVNVLPLESVPSLKDVLTWTRRAINLDNGLPLSNDIMAIFLKEEGKIVFAKVDTSGVFSWQFQPFYGSKEIQYFDPMGRNISVMPIPVNPKKNQVQDSISIGLRSYFGTNRIRKKINFLFRPEEPSTNWVKDTIRWPFEPDHTLLLQDYENVRSIEELTKLILTPLRIHKSKDGLIPKMVNPLHKPFFNGPPLFIVDRCLEADPNKALSVKIEHIVRMDFYNLPKTIGHFGHLGRHGVVSISTKFPLLNQSSIAETINGIKASDKNLNNFLEHKNDDLPAIDPLVYWNPDIMTNQHGVAEIIFNQSDDLGTFVIEVFAHTPGGFSHAMQKYQVKHW